MIDDISYKTLMGTKPVHIRFDKIDGFIKVYDGTSYLVLFSSERYNPIYKIIRYLDSEESSITYSISHNFAGIRIDSYNYLPIEKTLTFHNIVILIKSVANKKKNNYDYDIFLEKVLYEDKSDTYFFNECLRGINAIIERIKVSEGKYVNKTSESKDGNIYHCLYFLNKGFKFQANA